LVLFERKKRGHLIDFFHVGFDFSFERRQILSGGRGIVDSVIEAHAEFNHSVDSSGEALRFVKAEAGGEQ